MPVVDGIEATRAIRDFLNEKGEKNGPKIIGVTGHVQESFRQEGLNAGMDKIHSKPFYLKDLKAVLKECDY